MRGLSTLGASARFGGPLLLAAAATGAPAFAGTFDLRVGGVRIVQTLPGVTLVAAKPMMVRTVVTSDVALPSGTMVDGLLRVYVGGVEASFSPVYSLNGPFEPPAVPQETNLDHTLNFVFLPPESADVELVVEVNPAGPNQVCESDFSNNLYSSGSLSLGCIRRPELVYVPINYTVGGGLPNLQLIEPGSGDNFLQGMYPSDDWDYFLTPAGSKVWSSSLSGSGSGLLNSLITDLNMMTPRPDRIYGWVPGGLPYNGQASGIPGLAGMGNTQTFKFQRTFAHEIGHTLGRVHINNQLGRVGIDVEHHLAITENLSQIKTANLNDVMVPGLNTNQAWVYPGNHENYVSLAFFQCSTEAPAENPGASLLVGGLWNYETGELSMTDLVAFPGGAESSLVPVDQGNLIVRVRSEGGVEREFGVLANTTTDCAGTDSDHPVDPVAGFVVVLPAEVEPARVQELSIVDATSGETLQRIQRSDSAPQVEITAPRGAVDAATRLEWTATDADGSSLKHYVRYSPDGEQVIPLAANLTETGFDVDLARLPKLRSGKGWLEVLTTDGLNTTQVRTGGLQTAAALEALGGNPPSTFVLTPDTGSLFQKGATVVLHSSGWDLEDRSLRGGSVVWTSSIDGVIATGRVAQASDLSVGGHVITVTVTDSDGMQASDTTLVTITDRALPGAENCQPDVGFGGPGPALLEICGGDLSTGTTADVRLSGAAPNALLWVVSGPDMNPTALLGGTLVPVPVENILPATTDANGEWSIAGGVVGGGGPASLYVQAVYVDAGQTAGFGFSNCVRADILP